MRCNKAGVLMALISAHLGRWPIRKRWCLYAPEMTGARNGCFFLRCLCCCFLFLFMFLHKSGDESQVGSILVSHVVRVGGVDGVGCIGKVELAALRCKVVEQT